MRDTQTISDGYHATKPKRTVLTLLDFSKAFDRVWKEDAILRAVDKGLPLTFAKWLRALKPTGKIVVLNGVEFAMYADDVS